MQTGIVAGIIDLSPVQAEVVMEPIRPDDEDLRAAAKSKPAPEYARKQPTPREVQPKPPTKGRKGTVVLAFALVVLSAVVAGLWLEQGRRISVLEGQLEEADYWARQSKLALARFEGALSETGDSLEQTGSSMAQRLDGFDKEVENANNEIGKLWAVANGRNKKRLDDQQAQLEALQAESASQQAAVKAWVANLDTVKAGLMQQFAVLEQANGATKTQLETLQQSMAGVDGQINKRLERFEQEQSLEKAELGSRLQALEKKGADVATTSALAKAQRQLAELENTVKSIDASRAQLTSRLVRLSDEVDALRR